MQDSEAARIAHELQERAQKEMRDAEDRAVEGFFWGCKKSQWPAKNCKDVFPDV